MENSTENHSSQNYHLRRCRRYPHQLLLLRESVVFDQGIVQRAPGRATMSAADLHGLPGAAAAFPPAQPGSPPDAATLNEMIARNKFLEGG